MRFYSGSIFFLPQIILAFNESPGDMKMGKTELKRTVRADKKECNQQWRDIYLISPQIMPNNCTENAPRIVQKQELPPRPPSDEQDERVSSPRS